MPLKWLTIGSKHDSRNVMQPNRHSPEIVFCGDEWADAEDQVHPGVADDLDELDEVEAVLEVVIVGGELVAVPEDVGLDGVDAAGLGGGDEGGPHGGDAARVVDGGGDDELASAADDEGAAVVGDIGGGGSGD